MEEKDLEEAVEEEGDLEEAREEEPVVDNCLPMIWTLIGRHCPLKALADEIIISDEMMVQKQVIDARSQLPFVLSIPYSSIT